MWWWVMWHLFHEYQHITVGFVTEITLKLKLIICFYFQGEFDYPDTSAWTNEELGIPPDDFEQLKL